MIEPDATLVRHLIAAQFPRWAGLPVEPVVPGGCDHRTFRLGAEMSVRLPSAMRYAQQVGKEHVWLPRLAPHLPLAIPEPLALGVPGEGFPWPWAVYRWIEGEPLPGARADDRRLAPELAAFLLALQRIDARTGPAAGAHNFHRGGALKVYDAETRRAIAVLGQAVDAEAATAVWEWASASRWQGPPVWVHGDIAEGNLLVRRGRLCAVIDFGGCAVGDPASDLVIAWTRFEGEARQIFRHAMGLVPGTWDRACGWALWKALIAVAYPDGRPTGIVVQAQRTLAAVLSDADAPRT
jgi:aminoglycoside phosphotransferase (APT) family kinase protein